MIHKKDRLKILIGSDFVPGKQSSPYLCDGNIKTVFNDTLELFENSDFSIVNLECPIVTAHTPIKKAGPVLNTDIDAIKNLNFIKAFNLANNHILDHGELGLKNTLDMCKKYNFLTVGAGKNINDASEPLIITINNIRLAIMSMAEEEFSIAKIDAYGANGLNIKQFVRDIRYKSHNWDYLIVLFHGGIEKYQYPTPNIVDTCRFLIEEGANFVVCQHTHCVGTWEKYKDGIIVYGQGNLLFENTNIKFKEWFEGVFILLEIEHPNNLKKIKLIPYKQSYPEIGIHLMDKQEAKIFHKKLLKRSKYAKSEEFLKQSFSDYVDKHADRYLSAIYCKGKWWRRLHKRTKFLYKYINNNKKLPLLNILRCESLNEASIIALKKTIYKD